MAFKKRRVWDSQPQEVAELNPEFPISTYLMPSGGGRFQEIRGDAWTYNNAGSLSSGISTFGRAVINGSNGYLSRANPYQSGGFTVVIIFTPSTISGVDGIWSLADTPTSLNMNIEIMRSGADLRVYGTGQYHFTFSGFFAVGRQAVIALSSSNIGTSVDTTLNFAANGLTATTVDTQGTQSFVNEYLMSGYAGQPDGAFGDFFGWTRAESLETLRGISLDPWGTLFAPRSKLIGGAAGGATTHATTGVLAGAGGAIDGTAAHIAIHGTTGVLAGSGGAVTGAAARTRAHPTTGVLAGGGGAVVGSADHVVPGGTHDTSGALAGGGGAIDGTAAHIAIHGTSGALAGAGGAVVGTAARVAAAVTHDTSGALAGGGAVVEGRAATPQDADNSGGWPIYHRKKKKKDDDDELEPAVIEAVAVVPAPRRMVTLEKLIGKKAAAQVNEAQLSSAIRMLKRQRQDEELMLM